MLKHNAAGGYENWFQAGKEVARCSSFCSMKHISPAIATGLTRRHRPLTVHFMAEWEGGQFLGQDDARCLERAGELGLTLVTHDWRTHSTSP